MASPPPAFPLVTDETTVTLDLPSLASDLICPVCLSILKKVVATECLHRFCYKCIEKCLRQGKKECPSCRRHVATRRSLRHDTNLDAVIHALFPDLPSYEAEEDVELGKLQHEYDSVHILQTQQLEAQAAALSRKGRALPPISDTNAPSQPAGKARAKGSSAKRLQNGFSQARQMADTDADGMHAIDGDDETDRKVHRRHALTGLPARQWGGKRARRVQPLVLDGAQQQEQQPPLELVQPPAERLAKRPTPGPRLEVAADSLVFAFTRHAEETHLGRLAKEVVRTSRTAQVHHILKFLALKLELRESAWTSLRVSIRPRPGATTVHTPLQLDLTLGQTAGQLAEDEHLVLEYRLADGFTYADVCKTL